MGLELYQKEDIVFEKGGSNFSIRDKSNAANNNGGNEETSSFWKLNKETKWSLPNSSPIAILKLFWVTAEKVEATSGDPFPNARIVNPLNCHLVMKIRTVPQLRLTFSAFRQLIRGQDRNKSQLPLLNNRIKWPVQLSRMWKTTREVIDYPKRPQCPTRNTSTVINVHIIQQSSITVVLKIDTIFWICAFKFISAGRVNLILGCEIPLTFFLVVRVIWKLFTIKMFSWCRSSKVWIFWLWVCLWGETLRHCGHVRVDSTKQLHRAIWQQLWV